MNNPIFPPGRAVIFHGKGKPFQLVSKAAPLPGRNELLVRNLYTTICGSDVHTFCGRRLEPPHVVLGHEIVGEIIAIGSEHPATDLRGTTLHPGQLITWSIFAVPPGNSAPRIDIPQKSNNLFKYGHAPSLEDDVFNGGLADYCLLREKTAIIILNRDLPLPVAATINCAHATVAGALRVAGPIREKKVLIFGMGMLGISCIAMCREEGASWIGAIDKDQRRLDFAPSFGADSVFKLLQSDSILSCPDVDLVFDMTGDPVVMQIGLDKLNVGGCAVWIGAVFPQKTVPVDAQQIVRKILQIRGLHNYNYDDLLKATEFVENNYLKYPFLSLVEKDFPLEQTQDAFDYAANSRPVRTGIYLNK